MTHTIPRGNWHLALIDAIKNAQDGDTIECHTEAMQQLAEKAKQRMCPQKSFIFTLED